MPARQTERRTKRQVSDAFLPLKGEPTWDIAYLFPAQGAWTEHDYLRLDTIHDGWPLVELSNGRLEVLPMPTQTHQLIMVYFFKLLSAFTEVHAPGMVLLSGMRIRLQKGARARFRDPDVVYMKAEHAHRRHDEFWDGADLVLEVVSPDPKDRERDLEVKSREYARAGISEYWIIDPQHRQIRVLILEGRSYKLHGDFGPGMEATSILLPGFAVAVDAVLAAGSK